MKKHGKGSFSLTKYQFAIPEYKSRLISKAHSVIFMQTLGMREDLSPHFLFNVMSAIQHLVLSGQKKQAVQYFSIFGKYLRISLEDDIPQMVAIGALEDALNNYIALENLRFQKKIKLELFFTEEVKQKHNEYPYQIILQELSRVINEQIRFLPEEMINLKLDISAKEEDIVMVLSEQIDIKNNSEEKHDDRKKGTFERSVIRFSI